jgi:hypothetical protein
MTGYATETLAEAKQTLASGGWTATKARNVALRELILARALYRLGDRDGLGQHTLQAYANDLRGLFARHAKAVLARPVE